jgi:hypothetical protein
MSDVEKTEDFLTEKGREELIKFLAEAMLSWLIEFDVKENDDG